MYQNLENYLSEIGHYLAVKEDANEILAEIKSHILDKTESEFGTITEEGISKIISGYGKPRQVAAKYLEGSEIISPTFKRHLFLYTEILFAFHFALSLFAFLFHFDMVGFPFLYIPDMDIWQFLYYIPMAYIYDLGLVGIFLYLVTQKKKDIRLPWPKLFARAGSAKDMKKPNVFVMVLLMLVFSLFLYFFVRTGTMFFTSMNDPGNPVPLFGPNASMYYSILFLAMILCEVIGYAVRYINRSRWIDLIKNSAILVLLQFVWNSPIKPDYAQIPGFDLHNMAVTFVVIITAIVVFKFLKSLILTISGQFTGERGRL
jgi:hypothetical protein